MLDMLKERALFTRLRPHLMLSLSGKYSVTLYELLESVANQKKPVFEVSLEELKRYLAVPKGKLKMWGDFRKRALTPAVNELNKHSEDTGFTVSYELIKGYKGKVTDIHFKVAKVNSRKKLERKISKRKIGPKTTTEHSKLPRFSGEQYDKIRHALTSNGFGNYDLHAFEKDWRGEYEATAEEIKNPIGHFISFCKRRLEKQQPHGLFHSLLSRFTANS